MAVTIINFGEHPHERILIQTREDGVIIGGVSDDTTFVPANAIRTLIRTLEEYEEEMLRGNQMWGV